ncbi:MAG: hypothetical protein Roseis2KO_39500 [Roseivirga sp.]
MQINSNLLKSALIILILLCCGCQRHEGPPITSALFEKLLLNDAVTNIIVVVDKGYVEVYLDQEKVKSMDSGSGLEGYEFCTIQGIEKDFFLRKYDEFVSQENLTDAPTLAFESRPNLSDFFATYGLLLILVCAILFLAIILPLKIISQKKQIKDLENRIRSLEQKDH